MLLKSLLDDATKAKEKLENDYLEAHTERLILESQLASLSGGGPIEGYAKGSSIIIIFHHLCGGVVQLADSLTVLQDLMYIKKFERICSNSNRSFLQLKSVRPRLRQNSPPLRGILSLLNLIV